MLTKTLSEKEIEEKIIHDALVRKETARRNIYWFFRVYFPHYITYRIAPFQIEILQLLQNYSIKRVTITAFRNSGKSTFCTLIAPIWYAIGILQKKYIVMVFQNQERAKEALTNIKNELTKNNLLINDFGPFYHPNSEWAANTIVLAKYDVRITVLSIGEGMRGLRHGQYRPEVIVVDDAEDVPSAKQKDARDRLWQFINGELLPSGATGAKVIFIGNLVHEDSLMMRLKKSIESNEMLGVYKSYPLYDEKKNILWPDKFPDMNAINKLRRSNPSINDFLREYLLVIVPQTDRIIYPEDIHYYDPSKSLDFMENQFRFYAISIDPAVSEKDSADKTAIIVYKVYGEGEKLQIYIQPNPINKRLTVPQLVEEVRKIIDSFGLHPIYKVFIEGGSTQKGIYQVLVNEGIPAEEITPQGKDKTARLTMTKSWITKPIFLFPNRGAEELIIQLLHFGVERFDDLVDALTLFFLKILEDEIKPKNTVMSFPSTDIRGLGGSFDKDWADEEDEEIFRTLRWKNHQRIFG